VPLIVRVYPNGTADVNRFHEVGGLAFVVGELLDAGLLHGDVKTVAGPAGLAHYRREARLGDAGLVWEKLLVGSRDPDVLRSAASPFQPTGGLRLLQGNLGRAVVKTSAIKPERHRIEAPAVVFDRQEDLQKAFAEGRLDRDFVAVVRFQGPRANGMPELHKLMPPLGVLQDRGFQVALVTDGRMSGASGKVLSAIHLTPEAAVGGALAKLRDGDVVAIDVERGVLEVKVGEDDWNARDPAPAPPSETGIGRELFATFRRSVSGAEEGALTLSFE